MHREPETQAHIQQDKYPESWGQWKQETSRAGRVTGKSDSLESDKQEATCSVNKEAHLPPVHVQVLTHAGVILQVVIPVQHESFWLGELVGRFVPLIAAALVHLIVL